MSIFSKLLKNGIFCILSACFFFAIMGASMKYALRSVSVYEAVFFRSAISSLIIGGMIHLRRKRESFWGLGPF